MPWMQLWTCHDGLKLLSQTSKFRPNFRTQFSHALRHVRRTSSPCYCLTVVLSSHLLVLRLPHQSCTCLSHLIYILSSSSVQAVSVGLSCNAFLFVRYVRTAHLCAPEELALTLSNSYREFQQFPRNCFWYHLTLFVIIVFVIVIILLVFFGVQIHGRTLGEGGKQITNSSIFFFT
jgi:hypothetical protein